MTHKKSSNEYQIFTECMSVVKCQTRQAKTGITQQNIIFKEHTGFSIAVREASISTHHGSFYDRCSKYYTFLLQGLSRFLFKRLFSKITWDICVVTVPEYDKLQHLLSKKKSNMHHILSNSGQLLFVILSWAPASWREQRALNKMSIVKLCTELHTTSLNGRHA